MAKRFFLRYSFNISISSSNPVQSIRLHRPGAEKQPKKALRRGMQKGVGSHLSNIALPEGQLRQLLNYDSECRPNHWNRFAIFLRVEEGSYPPPLHLNFLNRSSQNFILATVFVWMGYRIFCCFSSCVKMVFKSHIRIPILEAEAADRLTVRPTVKANRISSHSFFGKLHRFKITGYVIAVAASRKPAPLTLIYED